MKWAPQSHYCVTFTVARKAARFSGVARMRLGVGRQGAHTVCTPRPTLRGRARANLENRAAFRATVNVLGGSGTSTWFLVLVLSEKKWLYFLANLGLA